MRPARPVEQAAQASRHGVGLLVLLGALTGIGPFSMDMYLPAFPEISTEFHAGAAQVQLSLTACMLGLAVGQLVVGPLADRYGRRLPVLLGMAGYMVTSLLCAFAPAAPVLTGVRFAQGVAAGAGIVVARAVVRDLYSGRAAAAYFSRLTLVFGVAPIIAPSIGGLVLRYTSWRGVFVVLAVIGAALFAAALRSMPETVPVERRTSGGVLVTLRAMGGLLRDRVFVGYSLALGFAGASMFAYISGSSFVVQDVFGASAQVYGLLFGLNALGFVAVGQLNGWLVHRVAPRRLLVGSIAVLLVVATGVLLAAEFGGLLPVAVGLFVFMSSIGGIMPNSTALALDRHPERAGAGAALMGAAQALCGALAAPLVGLAGTGSARPMALVMLAFAVLSAVALGVLTRRA